MIPQMHGVTDRQQNKIVFFFNNKLPTQKSTQPGQEIHTFQT